MSRDGRVSDPEFDFSDDTGLPRCLIVMLAIYLLLLVGSCSGGLYLFVTSQLTIAHSPIPTPQQTGSTVALATTTPSVTVQASPMPSATALAQASPITTVPTFSNPYPPYTGRLALYDSLSDNSNDYGWDTGTFASGTSCSFAGGSYHIAVSTRLFACDAEAITFSDLAYQVQMTILKGDRGGLFFRQVGMQGPYYYFSITVTGSYELDGYTGKNLTILRKGTSPAIRTGLSQSNVLAVVARGSMIDLYVNGQHLDQIRDTTSSTGLIGVAADAYASHQPAEVAFSNVQVWRL